MEWDPQVYSLYEKFIAQVPETYRPVVKTLLFQEANKKCMQRNSGVVNEADLITALLEITPEPFQEDCINTLFSFGVDVDRYIELQKIRKEHLETWAKFEKPWHPGNYWFTLYLTDRCNQNCLHCAADFYQSRPELSTEQWKSIVENLESSLRNQGRRGVYIWFGGEPTCRSDVRELIDFAGEKEYFHSISTNGILFTEDFIRFCVDRGMSHVFVSLDSADPQKADRIRGRTGAFESAKQAIHNAVKHGLLTIVTTTVMRQNIDELKSIQALVESWGGIPYFRAVIKQKRAEENWNEIGLNKEEYQRFYDFKFQIAVEAIRRGEVKSLPIFAIYDMVPFMEVPQNDRELTALEWGVGCQACRTISGIDINGDVFPCDYPSDLTLGNVLTERFEDIMNSSLFKDIRDRKRSGPCAECHHLDLCGGGCRVHAECESGDFFASFSYCWHDKEHSHETHHIVSK